MVSIEAILVSLRNFLFKIFTLENSDAFKAFLLLIYSEKNLF